MLNEQELRKMKECELRDMLAMGFKGEEYRMLLRIYTEKKRDPKCYE